MTAKLPHDERVKRACLRQFERALNKEIERHQHKKDRADQDRPREEDNEP